jgi:hypothetical protein
MLNMHQARADAAAAGDRSPLGRLPDSVEATSIVFRSTRSRTVKLWETGSKDCGVKSLQHVVAWSLSMMLVEVGRPVREQSGGPSAAAA